MRRIIVFSLTALLLLAGNTVAADTIYTWRDADGVKRYSNSQPPEDAADVQTIREIQYDQSGNNQRRQKYDRMVESASESADRHFEEQADKKAREANARREQQRAQQTRQIEEERARLQKQIEDLMGRALGPTFTTGMKENQIKQIQEKINQLATSPGGNSDK